MNTTQEAAAFKNATNPESVRQITEILKQSNWEIREGEDFETHIANDHDGHVYCKVVALGDEKYLVSDMNENPPVPKRTLREVAEHISRKWW